MSRPVTSALESHGRVHIYRRGDRYRVVWVDVNGVQRERVRATLPEARALAQRQSELLTTPGGATQPDTLFGALVSDWLTPGRHPQWSRRTRDTVVCDTRGHIISAVGGLRCCDITGHDLAGVLIGMAERGYSHETIHRVLRALRSIVRHGGSMGTWPQGVDPMHNVGMPANVAGRHSDELLAPADIPSAAQVEALADAMDAMHPRLGLMVRFTRDTGVRWAELIALRPRDVDLDNRTALVSRSLVQHSNGPLEEAPTKTKAGNRKVVFSAALVEPLRNRIAQLEPDGLLFGTLTTNVPWRRANWAKVVTRAREASGYPAHMAMHAMRHFAITSWLARGLPLGTVSRMAGHSSPEVTLRRYIGAGEDHLDQARAVL